MANSDETIIIGRIGSPYGVRGWCNVISFTQPSENVLSYQPWQVCIKGKWQTMRLVDGKPHGKRIVAQLEGCHDREQVAIYTNAEIAIKKEQLAKLPDDEYYWTDLEGLTVINHDGKTLGIIDHIMATGANDVLIVKGHVEHAIPYLPGDVIGNIDLDAGTMQVEWDAEVSEK